MAGALYAYNFGSVSYSRFGALAALALIAFTYFGGITMVSGAIIAGIGATEGLLPHGFDEWLGLSGNWAFLIGGIALIVTLLVNPEGIAGTGYKKKEQKRKRLAAEAAAEARARGDALPQPAARPLRRRTARRGRKPGAVVLSATGISVSFGGLRALDEVDLTVSEGQLVGLIGPNGAGKTTFIDAISGFVPYRGQCRARRACARRAARARTRRSRARADVAVDRAVRRPERAREPRGRVLPPVGLGDGQGDALAAGDEHEGGGCGPRAARARARWRTRCRRTSRRGSASSSGSGARSPRSRGCSVSTSRPPASTRGRARRSAHHLREVVDAGTPMLLVDHDMGLVLGISDYVVVLEFGKVIAQGPPEVVRRDPRVIKAYLGSAASELQPAVDAS